MRLALTFLLMALLPQTTPALPLIVAHRGASADAPENTLAAFQLAWEQGADAIEGDFHLTADNQIVCIHDKHTGRVAATKRSIRGSKLSTLRELDVGSWKSPDFNSERIPTLEQVLELVPEGKQIFIELKRPTAIVAPLLETLDRSPLPLNQITVITFDTEIIRELKTRRPELIVNLLSNIRRRTKGGPLLPTAEQLIEEARNSGADGIGIYPHPELSQNFAKEILSAGFPLHVWTVDEPSLAQRWTSWGTSSITTNTPAKIRKALK